MEESFSNNNKLKFENAAWRSEVRVDGQVGATRQP